MGCSRSKPELCLALCRCGDQYEDSAVQTFNACAVSAEKCVPQQSTPSAYPVPPETALDDSFDVSKFQGRWYITAGYNELFDTFDCQEHYFTSPEEGKIFGKINWRIQKPDGDFLERSTVQRFVQACSNLTLCCAWPAVNHLCCSCRGLIAVASTDAASHHQKHQR